MSGKALKRSVNIVAKPGDLEYLSWLGYRPDGTCPQCGEEWTDVCFAYDGPHCHVKRRDILRESSGAPPP